MPIINCLGKKVERKKELLQQQKELLGTSPAKEVKHRFCRPDFI